MSYRLKPAHALEAEIRRIASDQIGKALEELGDPDRGEAVHAVRKRLKKLRGLLRLVRSGNQPFFEAENARYRDIGQRLSAIRDRTALIEALDALSQGDRPDASGAVRAALEHQRRAAEAQADPAQTVRDAARTLEAGRRQLDELVLTTRGGRGGERALVAAGVARIHAAARRALKRAAKSRAAGDLHELRKRVKDHAMHLKLVERFWPDGLKPLRRAAEGIAEDLGRDHDYAVLRDETAAEPASFGSPGNLAAVRAAAAGRQNELQGSALAAAARLLVDRRAAVERRVRSLHRLAEEAETARR